MRTNVVQQPQEVFSRLAEIGLKEDLLFEAIRAGMAARFSCTRNHPPLAAGFYGWSEAVRGLRDALMPEGWGRDDAGLLSVALSPGGDFAIAIATGDDATGDPSRTPCTKSSKGPRTKDAIQTNCLQLNLFAIEDVLQTDEEMTLANSRLTRWLLIHFDDSAKLVRSELSTPILVAKDSKIAGWEERIILGTIPFDDNSNLGLRNPEEGPLGGATEIDVPIRRRA